MIILISKYRNLDTYQSNKRKFIYVFAAKPKLFLSQGKISLYFNLGLSPEHVCDMEPVRYQDYLYYPLRLHRLNAILSPSWRTRGDWLSSMDSNNHLDRRLQSRADNMESIPGKITGVHYLNNMIFFPFWRLILNNAKQFLCSYKNACIALCRSICKFQAGISGRLSVHRLFPDGSCQVTLVATIMRSKVLWFNQTTWLM